MVGFNSPMTSGNTGVKMDRLGGVVGVSKHIESLTQEVLANCSRVQDVCASLYGPVPEETSEPTPSTDSIIGRLAGLQQAVNLLNRRVSALENGRN